MSLPPDWRDDGSWQAPPFTSWWAWAFHKLAGCSGHVVGVHNRHGELWVALQCTTCGRICLPGPATSALQKEDDNA